MIHPSNQGDIWDNHNSLDSFNWDYRNSDYSIKEYMNYPEQIPSLPIDDYRNLPWRSHDTCEYDADISHMRDSMYMPMIDPRMVYGNVPISGQELYHNSQHDMGINDLDPYKCKLQLNNCEELLYHGTGIPEEDHSLLYNSTEKCNLRENMENKNQNSNLPSFSNPIITDGMIFDEPIGVDLNLHYVVSGQRPQNMVKDPELSTRNDDYPKIKNLCHIKEHIRYARATPARYMQIDLKKVPLSPALFGGVKFDVVYIDPPWAEYRNRIFPGCEAPSVDLKPWSMRELLSLQIDQITENPSFIFLWCGESHLCEARVLLKKWGFRRCEDITWIKRNNLARVPKIDIASAPEYRELVRCATSQWHPGSSQPLKKNIIQAKPRRAKRGRNKVQKQKAHKNNRPQQDFEYSLNTSFASETNDRLVKYNLNLNRLQTKKIKNIREHLRSRYIATDVVLNRHLNSTNTIKDLTNKISSLSNNSENLIKHNELIESRKSLSCIYHRQTIINSTSISYNKKSQVNTTKQSNNLKNNIPMALSWLDLASMVLVDSELNKPIKRGNIIKEKSYYQEKLSKILKSTRRIERANKILRPTCNSIIFAEEYNIPSENSKVISKYCRSRLPTQSAAHKITEDSIYTYNKGYRMEGVVMNRVKEHCLVGLKGAVRRNDDIFVVHTNTDTDVICAEEPTIAGSTTKPTEMYDIIENFAQGRKRLELFACDHNIRPGWVSIGNQISCTRFDGDEYSSWFTGKEMWPWTQDYRGGRWLGTTSEIEKTRPHSPRKDQMSYKDFYAKFQQCNTRTR